MDKGAWRATVHGIARVRHVRNDLAHMHTSLCISFLKSSQKRKESPCLLNIDRKLQPVALENKIPKLTDIYTSLIYNNTSTLGRAYSFFYDLIASLFAFMTPIYFLSFHTHSQRKEIENKAHYSEGFHCALRVKSRHV